MFQIQKKQNYKNFNFTVNINKRKKEIKNF